MASPAAPLDGDGPRPPEADAASIRRCLSPRLLMDFDAEWSLVLDQAKESKSLKAVHGLLRKWQAIAYGELQDPGSHYRMLGKAERILQTGDHLGEVPARELHALIGERLGR
ncbi:DUF6247 family protein [Amycolatopsis thailandensis]|uniref:DUF6247 family protein n=1 Tax=Amycolatopsis thailandensis TaxID=589330 RepID=UPI003640583F